MASDSAVCSPDVVSRVSFLIVAVMPWYAVASGIYGLYFFVLMLVPQGASWLPGVQEVVVCVLLAAVLPLAVLLLLIVPVGAVFAVLGRPLGGWAGRLVRFGLLVAMGFGTFYAALLLGVAIVGVAVGEGLWWQGWGNSSVLLIGLVAAWKAWRYLRCDHVAVGLG